jgi:hypothetical protein
MKGLTDVNAIVGTVLSMRNFPVKNRRTRYGRSLIATPPEPQRLDECPSGSAALRVTGKHRKQPGDTAAKPARRAQ